MRGFITLVVVLLTTVSSTTAQKITNYVKNGDFESYNTCPPDTINTIHFANYWSGIDTFRTYTKGICFPEYVNECNLGGGVNMKVPSSIFYYQYPHSRKGMVMMRMFYDETSAPHPPAWVNRDYLQGRLYKNLIVGKSYCVSFYVNLAEQSTYAVNKIGAYLDNSSIDTAIICTQPITNVKPQLHTTEVMVDTMNWKKIEGTFTANGTETFITIGNFFPKDSIAYYVPFGYLNNDAYYLIDDVAVLESDLLADAGPDRWVEATKTVKIGRFDDSTATALDCYWYHKGMLIDSGATISVAANATVGAKDTYVVIQTVCGLVKTDTVEVRTVPLGVQEWDAAHALSVFPNPSKGAISVQALHHISGVRVYDLSGRVQQYPAPQSSNQTSLQLSSGMYIIEVETEDGVKERKKLLVE